MDKRILGLHHVTAISDNAKRNFDFYTHVPGLRMVKRPSTSTIPMACSYSIAASPAQPDLLTSFVNCFQTISIFHWNTLYRPAFTFQLV
jgi:glyoxalase family protein